MSHEDGYPDELISLLEAVWGEGYLMPGGPGNVAKILEGTQPRGKRTLDVGSGIGGLAFEMAGTHEANEAIDSEAGLVERAVGRCSFRRV